VRDQDVAVQIDARHFFRARNRTASLFLTVLSALKETVSPDFVLNFTRVGFLTVFTAMNLTLSLAMRVFYHSSMRPKKRLHSRWGGTANESNLCALDGANDEQQDHGADDRHDEASQQSVRSETHQPEYESAQKRSDHADDQINAHAHSAALHDLAGKPASDDAD
jgi:hypothetical protein